LAIINDILDLSKIDANKLALEEIEFNLHHILDNLANLFTTKFKEKGLRYFSVVDPGVPARLSGDSLRLGQVLINLIGNALKFTETGEIVLRVGCPERSAEGAILQFSVRDTGIGLAREKMDALFAAFSQADSSTTRKYGGTGLGLSICKKLVAMMGGGIWVESVLGQGSTFFFTVRMAALSGEEETQARGTGPRGAHIPPPLAAPGTALPARQQPPTIFSGCLVLLAEDNHFNQMLAVEILTNRGMTVEVANNGKEAVAMAGPRFAAVLMDIQMPEMDGFEATRLIRQKEGCAGIPIIAMTAHAMEGYRERCLEGGMDDYVTKPFEPAELFAVLGRFIGTDPAATADGAAISAQVTAYLSDAYHWEAAMVDKMARQAKESLRAQLAAAEAALAAGDVEGVRRAAHTIKGNLRSLGLGQWGELAENMERLQPGPNEEPTTVYRSHFQELQYVLAPLVQL
jgi:CheY-like chemotaxis protein